MLEKELQRFSKSKKFKNVAREKFRMTIMGSVSGNRSGNPPDNIYKYANMMRDILENRVSTIVSRSGNQFLNDIVVDATASEIRSKGKTYISIGVSFRKDSKKTIVSKSLYPEKYKNNVYMPLIVNNSWRAGNYVYGNYRGKRIRSALEWPYKNQKGFMYEVIKEFNDKTPDYVKAEMHVAYDGGTFGSGTLYKDINYL